MKYRCMIVIPCFNEAERLDSTAFANFMTGHPEIRFLFVNDGSQDATGKVLLNLCKNGQAEYLELPRNLGKAEAVRQGMLKASEYDAEYAGFWDADLAAPLAELPRMLSWTDGNVIYLSGCRLLRLGGEIHRKLFRHILGRVFATVISVYLNLPVYDTQCGAKLYKLQDVSELFSKPFSTRWLFDVELIKRLEIKYGRDIVLARSVEVPLTRWEEIGGSKLRLGRVLADFYRLFFYSERKR